MERQTRRYFFNLGWFDPDEEELLQNVITLAWLGVMRLHTLGKWEPSHLKACLRYAIRRHLDGRTIYHARRPRPPIPLVDVRVDELLDPRNDPIPSVVQTRVDFAAYRETLSERWRQFADDALDVGPDNLALAALWGLTPGRACQIRRQIRDGYLAYVDNFKR
jgi:hypothetical protein